jgi:hypothetical protein
LKFMRALVAAAAAALCLTSPAAAQPNVVPGRNVSLSSLNAVLALGRSGAFPNGINGCAESTTACNVGVGNLPWQQPMNANHPFISFLFARVANDRIEQISDRSFVKHGFFATNSGGCGTCQHPGSGQLLGPNCSDTYSTTNNGDNFWLGPADEIDPWTGAWTPQCSHFDSGEPAVAAPFNCDGNRSLSQGQAGALGSVGHRVRVRDADFNVPGAQFFAQAQYTTQGEAETLRNNNTGYRQFNATWNGATWGLSMFGSLVHDSVLRAWTGATLTSNTNGADDGRVFVAVKVTGPVNGLYHYEYAVHNRDNKRGVSSVRFPVCAEAIVVDAAFRDIDQDGANDWTVTRTATEVVFSTTTNPLRWNSFFNFSFDSDAGPAAAAIGLDQFSAGAGAASFTVDSTGPVELYNVNLGGGCGTPDVPDLHAAGNPAKATLGNNNFAIEVTGVAPNAPLLLWASALDGSLNLTPNCAIHMNVAGLFLNLGLNADANGKRLLTLPIPNDPSFEGFHVNFLMWEIQAGGAISNQADPSNTLRVRIGNSISGCP